MNENTPDSGRKGGSTVSITNNYYAPIGQKIDHVETVNFTMDGDGTFHFDNVRNFSTDSPLTAQHRSAPANDRLKAAIKACKSYMWSASAYAVVYRVMQEDYEDHSSRPAFEERMALMGFADCKPGTLDNAFARNNFLASPSGKWEIAEGKNTSKAVKMAAALRKALDMKNSIAEQNYR